jgi:hypothetical protein
MVGAANGGGDDGAIEAPAGPGVVDAKDASDADDGGVVAGDGLAAEPQAPTKRPTTIVIATRDR